MYYVKGQGYFEDQPNTYLNQNGQKVTQSGGVLRNSDGTLHSAYKFQPQGNDMATTYLGRRNTRTSTPLAAEADERARSNYERIMRVLAKWKRGEALTEEERGMLTEYEQANGSLPRIPAGSGYASTANGKKTMTNISRGSGGMRYTTLANSLG